MRDFFHIMGLDIRRWDDMSIFSHQLSHILKYLEVDLVLDVGAHWGQYAQMLFRTGFNGRIISFEPACEAYKNLEKARNEDANWGLVNLGLGNIDGWSYVNIAGGNGSSSSILAMNQAHLDVAPYTAYIRKEKIEIARLDTHDWITKHKAPFLKIDAQGYEMPILEGATGVIDQIKAVQVELSTEELYEEQALDWQLKNWLSERGFYLWALNPFLYNPKTGKLLQYDAIFVRE